MDLAARFTGEPGTVVLPSGTDLDCAGYNILGIWPWLGLQANGERLELTVSGRTNQFETPPLDFLESLLERYTLLGQDFIKPVGAGLLGYLAYDLKDGIEALPNTCVGQNLPDLCLYAPSLILIQERATGQAQISLPLLSPVLNTSESSISPKERCCRILDSFFSRTSSPLPRPASFTAGAGGLSANFTRPAYMEAVEKIIDYIRAGDIYQVNLSQQFQTRFEGDPFTLFRKLFKANPAPFFGFIQAGDHQILSTSPERFIKREGDELETRPIKGTIQRGRSQGEDLRLGRELMASPKDDAELSMIVDLMRNDLGRVAQGGTVRVHEHKRLEPYDNVYHLVSVVKAQLAKGKNSVDIIRAAFPGGSITGCPKIRSMEIIDELEPVSRHVYTGSLGYIGFHNTMDLSIAIRTATVAGGSLTFSVGGGIVYDSDPALEYQETLHKGKTLMDALEAAGDGQLSTKASMSGQTRCPPTSLKAWINGRLVAQEEAVVSAFSPGFQYGAGFFETIRVEKGTSFFLDEHIKRLSESWKVLFQSSFPSVSWPDVIRQVIKANSLDREVAAVKIIVAQSGPGKEPFVAVFSRPYVHRLNLLNKAESDKQGLNLITYPKPRHTFLADHKTLNYLYYDMAGRFARNNGGDEALILNVDGTLSETNTCSILAVSGRKIFIPQSDHALPGVTQHILEKLLPPQGYTVEHKKLTKADLLKIDGIIVVNSLMGAVPVTSLDGTKFPLMLGVCTKMNQLLGFKTMMPSSLIPETGNSG